MCPYHSAYPIGDHVREVDNIEGIWEVFVKTPARQPGREVVGEADGAVPHECEDSEEGGMSKVRVLVGTRKGAFVLESDAMLKRWEISGPHFAGWEIYHI